LLQRLKLKHEKAVTLQGRIIKHVDCWLVFVNDTRVGPTNNLAERSLRPLVIMQKICFGNRSREGGQRLAKIMSVKDTARRHVNNPLHIFYRLFTQRPAEVDQPSCKTTRTNATSRSTRDRIAVLRSLLRESQLALRRKTKIVNQKLKVVVGKLNCYFFLVFPGCDKYKHESGLIAFRPDSSSSPIAASVPISHPIRRSRRLCTLNSIRPSSALRDHRAMASIAFINGTVVLPDRLIDNGMVCTIDSKITYAGQCAEIPDDAEIIDANGGMLSPGFIDLHVHGGAGADFMDGTPEAVITACAAHLRHGTTTIFPTTTTGSEHQIMNMIDACATAKQRLSQQISGVANIAGVHLYGPYFAEDKVGCHSENGRRSPVAAEFHRYFDTGLIRIATCAAELPGAAEFYDMGRQHKCLITCGHSNSTWSEMQRAFDAGMRHVDHFWCAMSSVPSIRQRCNVPMQGSMAEFVLMSTDMSTEVIADGWHLAPELLEFAFRMKGPERLCLVTDCNRAMDLPAGEYRFGCPTDGTMFRSDGKVGWAPNGSLASSIMGMDHMVRHMKQSTSANLAQVIRMASLTPAERTGIAHETGSLEAGKRADILVMDEDLNVVSVFVGGKKISG